MSLKTLFSDIVDDVAALAAPAVARMSGAARRIAVAESDALAIYEVIGDRVRRLDDNGPSKDGARAHGELRLQRGSVLTQRLTLPAATQNYVEPVLNHRLEKLTPWAPDRVIYGYRVAGETGDGSITVDFAATSRETADAWVAKAEARGFAPTAIGAAGGPLTEPLGIDLWQGARNVMRRRVRRTVTYVAAAALLAPLPVLAVSFWTLGASQERLQAIEARSVSARTALRASAGVGGRDAALIARKGRESVMLTLIDRIAQTLPDGAALRELEIDPEKVRIAGVSDAAPALLGLLAETDGLGEAKFSAPVTRNADGRDGFEILADRQKAGPP